MVRGRDRLPARRWVASVLVVGTLTVLLGCEAADLRDNELRPPKPIGISVQVDEEAVTVSPRAVSFEPRDRVAVLDGPEPGEVPADPDQPMPIELTVANATSDQVRIVLVGPERHVSNPITPTGTAMMETKLPTGAYEVRVAGRPEARPGALHVGPLRLSPQNDLAIP